jgi:16S rRNA G1207 methylase RsmC
MKTAEQLKQDIVFEAVLRGHRLCFHTTWGLFSPRQIDEGSRLLLQYLTVKDGDVTLDLGCGYGSIGLTIAKATPNGMVHLVDRDFVALEFAQKNAAINGITNCKIYPSNAFSMVGRIKFDTIVSNLPAKVGRELLYIILSDARDHLQPGGQIVVVTISGLKEFIKNNFKDVFGNYEKLKQGQNYTVARAVKLV